MATGNIVKLPSDEAAFLVAKAGLEFGADTDKLFAAFKQQTGGKEVSFQGDPGQVARKIAAAMSGAVPAPSANPAQPSAPSAPTPTYREGTKVRERGTPEQRSEFIKTAGETEDTVRNLLTAYNTGASATQQAIGEYGSAAETSGRANAVLAYTKGNAETERIRQQEALLSQAGLAPSENASLINRRIRDSETFRAQRESLANEINANAQIDPLRDPLGWFLGQLKNEFKIGQHNSLINQENAALQDIADRHKLVSSQLSITPQAASQHNREIVNSHTAAVAHEASTIAAKARVDASRAQQADTIERLRLSGIPLDIQERVIRQMNIEQSQSVTTGAGSKQSDEDAEFALIKRGRDLYGMPEIKDKAEMRYINPVERQMWGKLGSGQDIGSSPGERIAVFQGVLGITPEVMARTDQKKALAMQDILAGSRQYLGSLSAQASDIKNPASKVAADKLKAMKSGPETTMAGVDGFLEQQRDEFSKGAAPTNNIYKLRIGEALMSPEFAENTVAKKLMASDVRKLPTFDDSALTAILTGAAKADLKSIPKLADDTAKLYASGIVNQFASKGYGTLGIQKPDGYPVVVNGKVVNLMDRASIEQHLLIEATRQAIPLFETPDFVTPEGGRKKLWEPSEQFKQERSRYFPNMK